jgi:hypothetical protein
VLGDELGIGTENTAKWLTEWRRIPELVARRDHLAGRLARHHQAPVGLHRHPCQPLADHLDRHPDIGAVEGVATADYQ